MKCVIAIFCAVVGVTSVLSDDVVLCYWGSWANGRPGLGRFGVSDLPSDLCTHIVYSFIGLTEEGVLTYPAETTEDGKSNSITDLMALKLQNSNLKLLVAIGGWAEGSENFSTVTNNETLRATFVANLVTYLETRGFDGLDLDWEYPGQRGGADTDKEAFIWLLRDLKAAFDPRGWLLTAAVAVTQYHIDLSYDVPSMNEYLDFIHLMTYDYYGSWDPQTGVNAPLYPLAEDVTGVLNVDASLRTWIANGASPSKIVLGLAIYGRCFTLESMENTGIGAPSAAAGIAGPYTQEAGFWSYYEICLHQAANEWNITEVEGNYVYGHTGNFWIGYDNPSTTYAKGKYARDNNLAGIMFWAIDLDDFDGLCGTPFPIIRAAVEGFTSSAGVSGASWIVMLGAMFLLMRNV